MKYCSPSTVAEKLLNDYYIMRPEDLDLYAIADGEFIYLRISDLGGYQGQVMFNAECAIVTLDSKIKDMGQARFTIAHEFGHYFLERNNETVNNFRCSATDIYPTKSSPKAEKYANEFAAELLMYKPWFVDFVKNKPIKPDLFISIVQKFNVSLSSAAIRYAEIGEIPIAAIMSTNNKISWVAINEDFPLKFIRPKSDLCKLSSVSQYFETGRKTAKTETVSADIWFPEDFNLKRYQFFHEFNFYFDNYNAVLTILWQ